ncbi:hypothetical protein [Sunxiuqinia elliptica]|uniref:Uncharacterized protein n=1 Tax=Sunxiuqinia elliptica TaxID=655355 RepID=A0A1I2JKT6_9BACT|nr:hypothetical protein [Sunxiuqinia elliptica]SFF55462.1 hypothetical protein SAMN05216283_10945 [Sunxiuqinia elliptica]
MRTVLSFLLIVALSLPTLAQDKNFDLSKYKTPDYKRHELNTFFNLGGTNNQFSQSGEDYKQANFSSTVNLNYSYVANTRQQQTYFRTSLLPRYVYEMDKQGTQEVKINKTNFNFDITGFHKYYLTEDHLFLKVSPDFNWYSSNHDQKNSSLDQNNATLSMQLGLGAGIGRIEPVSDYWQSYYILQSLDNQGLLKRALTEEDFLNFASLATKLKNKRFFDHRLRKISELTALDSLMQEEELLSNNSIAYFATLNDYWSFANIAERHAGRELSIMLTPEYMHNSYEYGDYPKQESHYTVISPSINYSCSKPLNLHWDRVFNATVARQFKLDESEITYGNLNRSLVSSSIGFNYYPNFRTSAQISLNYLGLEIPESMMNNEKVWQNNLNLKGAMYYYLSPQLRIQGSLEINYTDKSTDDIQDEHFRLTGSLGLSYAIF